LFGWFAPPGFKKLNRLRLHVPLDVSEFAPGEAKAFDGEECPEGEAPLKCVMWAIRKDNWEDFWAGISTRDSLSAGESSKSWEVQCKACGFSRPFDILETSESKFDSESGNFTPESRSVLSKTGARRGREKAEAEMYRIAERFDLSNTIQAEAYRLFRLFTEHGASKGGRGHKTTVVAALHIASRAGRAPIPVKELVEAHAEDVSEQSVNKFLRQAKTKALFEVPPPEATELVDFVLAKIGSDDPEVAAVARKFAGHRLNGAPAKAHAAAAVYQAAKSLGIRSGIYSGAFIGRQAFLDRRQVYRWARLLEGKPKPNPPNEDETLSSSDIKLLRKVRTW